MIDTKRCRIHSRHIEKVISPAQARYLQGHAKLLGQGAGDNVGFTVIADGQQHLGLLDADLFQHVGRCTVADEGHDVELLAEFAKAQLVHIDNDDVVSAKREYAGELSADAPRTHDYYFHCVSGPVEKSAFLTTL